MINNSRTIENVYEMLKYLYEELNSKRFKGLDISCIDNIDDLYALVISRWCASIAKEGLYEEYVEVDDEELTSPKGQINFQQSIVNNTLSKGSLICSYDELSRNIYMNHLLKGTLQYLLYYDNVADNTKLGIKKALQLFNGVDYTDIRTVHWKDIKFNSSNMRYKNLLDLCKNTVMEHDLVSKKLVDDNKRIYLLFKKQLMYFIKNKYKDEDTAVEVFETAYNLEVDPPFEVKVNKHQQLLVIREEKYALLMCIRLQDEHMMDDRTLGRKHINEMVVNLRKYAETHKIKLYGAIVYVNTDKTKLNINPMTMHNSGSYLIGETIVDLHDHWRFVCNKIDECYKCFILKNKVKKINKK